MRFLASFFVLAALLFGTSAQATVIDFDNVANGSVINNAYSNKGVTFSVLTADGVQNALAISSAAHSGSNVFGMSNKYAAFGTMFDARTAIGVAKFTTGQTDVGIYAQAIPTPEQLLPALNKPYLTAYDIDGKYLGAAYYPVSEGQTGYGSFQRLAFHSDTLIYSIHWSSQQNVAGSDHVYGTFDDVAFGSDVADKNSKWNGGKPIATPEPSMILLFGSGMAGLTILGRKFRKN